MFGLAHLLSPVDAAEFRQQFCGRKATWIPGGRDKFADLFDWPEINDLINYCDLRYPDAALLYEGQTLPADSLSQLEQWLGRGATLVLNQVHKREPLLRQLSVDLSRDLNTPVWINCYVSDENKRGFDWHYDNHDVYAMQIAGEKRWWVSEPTLKWPVGPTRRVDSSSVPDPYLECELSPGDLLYIPCGHIHRALAQSPSVHLTVGLERRSAIDFLQWYAREVLTTSEEFRRDFPVIDFVKLGGASNDEHLTEFLRDFQKQLTEHFEKAPLTSEYLRYCMVTNPLTRTHQLPQELGWRGRLTPETRLRLQPGQKVVFHNDRNGNQQVLVRGYSLRMDETSCDVLRAALSLGNVFSGQELMDKLPDSGWEKMKNILIKLIETSILCFED